MYAGTGWTAMRDRVAREPNEDNDHWAEQTAVLYPSADRAQKFFDKVKSEWEACAEIAIWADDADATYLVQIDDLTAEDDLITQTTTQEDSDGVGVPARAVGGIESDRRSVGIADTAFVTRRRRSPPR